ncbi:hypothetical protein AO073_15640 [Pseudomonas syringae ICMP 11293]|nr:hypothetical protein AO073_15640 [Pseudomonas syringae ICMP 11293]
MIIDARSIDVHRHLANIGAQGYDAVTAPVTPLLRVFTSNHQIGTVAHLSPVVRAGQVTRLDRQ